MTKTWAFELNHIHGRHLEPFAHEDPAQIQTPFDDTLARLKEVEAAGFVDEFIRDSPQTVAKADVVAAVG